MTSVCVAIVNQNTTIFLIAVFMPSQLPAIHADLFTALFEISCIRGDGLENIYEWIAEEIKKKVYLP
jgi:hypothetical protein